MDPNEASEGPRDSPSRHENKGIPATPSQRAVCRRIRPAHDLGEVVSKTFFVNTIGFPRILLGIPMFEQAFKNIDDVLRKEAGCTTELDYAEQTSWLLFLKYLDGLEEDKATEAAR